MKASRFNVVHEVGDKTYIYNTNSAGVLSLNPEYAAAFSELTETGHCPKEDLLAELKRGAMAVPEEIDELEALRARSLMDRFHTQSLNLTIAPTLECNFACTYCYEEGYRHNTMTDEVEQAVVAFVKRYIPAIKALSIAWYGGEPLLGMNRIEAFTQAFREMLGDQMQYHAAMVTNGYLLNEQTARKLVELGVGSVQVTLDGPADVHDRRRMLRGGQGTFHRILANVAAAQEILPGMVIRVNVDRSNLAGLDQLLDEFEQAGIKGKVPFYLAPVDNINDTCGSLAESCLGMAEFSDEEVAFYKRAMARGFRNVSLPPANPGICGAVSANSFVIDPKGDLYKCWDTVGMESEKVGSVFQGPKLCRKHTEWLLYEPLSDAKCLDCSVAPICLGGCPYQSIKSGEHKCMAMRYNAADKLGLFTQLKAAAGGR